jgi:hypothetical protein
MLLHDVVGSDTPFNITLPGAVRKFWPAIVICVLGRAVPGVILKITGAGTFTVTVAEADLVESA